MRTQLLRLDLASLQIMVCSSSEVSQEASYGTQHMDSGVPRWTWGNSGLLLPLQISSPDSSSVLKALGHLPHLTPFISHQGWVLPPPMALYMYMYIPLPMASVYY